MSKFNSILAGGDVGNIGIKALREQREIITNKWEQYHLLDGLDGLLKENVAQLLENQASYMINESTTSDVSGSFETVAFPVIRRIFSKLLANEIVSVQALSMPIGRVYFYNPKISKRKSDGSHYDMDGSYNNAASNNYSLNGDLRKTKTGGTQFETYSLYDGYYAETADSYGNALFDRTTGKISVKTPLLSASTYTAGVTKLYSVVLTGFTTTSAGKLVGPIGGAPMDTEEFLGSLKISASTNLTASDSIYTITSGNEVPFRIPAQKYGKAIVDSSGNLKLELDLTYPDASGVYSNALTGTTATTFTASYSVYSDLEEDADMAEVSFDLDYVTVDVGQPRKLRATFTPEISQDASAFHSMNVEAELTKLLTETVAAEIDRTILRELRASAAWMARWDYSGFKNRVGITRQDYNQELIEKVNQISAAINKSTQRGGATWLVVSPEVSSIFNTLTYFHVTDASPEEAKYSMGIEKIGSISGRYTVFVDTNAPANTILVGHKGDGIFHAGYIYCPYVPIMLLPKMLNYTNGTNVHMVMSRFATKVINNRFYGKVLVQNIPTFATGAELRG